MATPKICSIDGCGKPFLAKGWCRLHYSRWGRYSDPLAGRTPEGEPMRFLREAILSYAGDDCLIWPYARLANGYPSIRVKGTTEIASRLVCAAVHGPAPTPDHEAAHSCGRGHEGCVAKRHLRWATHAENMAETIDHGRTTRGERCSYVKLTEADVREIRSLKGTMSRQRIADRFGVSSGAISAVFSGRAWRWVE